jgi:hypothetical protein
LGVFRVLLVTRYETALRRATADPTRGISKEPDFLSKMYQRFNNELPGMAYDLRLDSEESSPGVLAARVVAALKEGRTVIDSARPPSPFT